MSYTLDSFGNIVPDVNNSGIRIDSFGNVFGRNGVQTNFRMPFGYNGPTQFGLDSVGNQASNFTYGSYLNNKFPWQK